MERTDAEPPSQIQWSTCYGTEERSNCSRRLWWVFRIHLTLGPWHTCGTLPFLRLIVKKQNFACTMCISKSKNDLQDTSYVFPIIRDRIYSILDARLLIHKLFLLSHIQNDANSPQALPAKQAPYNPARTFQSLIRASSTSSSNMHKGIKLSPLSSREGQSQSKNMSRQNLRRLEVY